MANELELHEYLCELRRHVCEHCIVRRPGTPPCEPRGIGCGIERHLPTLVEICRTVESQQIDPYLERMLREICADCELRDKAACPCPLKYLLPLAVEAIETVQLRRKAAIDASEH